MDPQTGLNLKTRTAGGGPKSELDWPFPGVPGFLGMPVESQFLAVKIFVLQVQKQMGKGLEGLLQSLFSFGRPIGRHRHPVPGRCFPAVFAPPGRRQSGPVLPQDLSDREHRGWRGRRRRLGPGPECENNCDEDQGEKIAEVSAHEKNRGLLLAERHASNGPKDLSLLPQNF